jgi:hypothetical protein
MRYRRYSKLRLYINQAVAPSAGRKDTVDSVDICFPNMDPYHMPKDNKWLTLLVSDRRAGVYTH